ncbi:MAG: hypothetical protein COB53_10485 [Elusimicrobia bacterium]|nr:MAG: hypothetical protein COB53_10485 [Elusimicrobiota bacterium]
MKRIAAVLLLLLAGCAGSSKRAEPIFPAGTAVLFGLPYGAIPEDDLITGGQPKMNTIVGAARAGVKSLISLRSEAERPHPALVRGWAKKSNIEFYHLPIAIPQGITRENAEKLAALLDKAEKPVLLHCGTSNRVGALLALRAFYVDGWPAEEAIIFGRKAGLGRLERTVRQRIVEEPLKKP